VETGGAGGDSGVTRGADNLKENDRCNFKGLVADKENCQSKRVKNKLLNVYLVEGFVNFVLFCRF
jgi:hypothetical protein